MNTCDDLPTHRRACSSIARLLRCKFWSDIMTRPFRRYQTFVRWSRDIAMYSCGTHAFYTEWQTRFVDDYERTIDLYFECASSVGVFPAGK